MSSDARAREREANRIRMASKRNDPDYRAAVNARRQARDRERKMQDPSLRPRLTANSKRYYESRKDDPSFWETRKDYLRRWKAERRLDEAFEDFLARVEAENPNDAHSTAAASRLDDEPASRDQLAFDHSATGSRSSDRTNWREDAR
jgi:hypothetical protein